jgi:hypothetical protein
MTNDFFNHDSSQTKHTLARAESLNGQFDAVAAGFDKLPNEAEIKQGRVTWGTDSGTADAYVVTLPYAPSAYTEGLEVRFKPGAENTGAATINVNGLGVKAIKRHDGSAVQAGDIVAGAGYVVIYDGTDFRLVSPPQGIVNQAQDWATKTGGEAATGEGYSAKEHAIGTTVPEGSAKDWATETGAAVDGSEYAAKEYAHGDLTATGGSAKAWAQDSESPDGTTTKSAKTWAAEAAASATASAASATAAAAAEATAEGYADSFLTPAASAPTTRDDGTALQVGDVYHNTTDGKTYIRVGGAWVASAADLGSYYTKPEVDAVAGGPVVVASGAIASGEVVKLNADGTVSVVTSTIVADALGAEASEYINTYINGNGAAAFDPFTGKIGIFFTNGGNYDRVMAVVGVVSGEVITFGAEIQSPNTITDPYVYSAAASGNGDAVVWLKENYYGRSCAVAFDFVNETFGNIEQIDTDTSAVPTPQKVVWVASAGGYLGLADRSGTDEQFGFFGTVSGTTMTWGGRYQIENLPPMNTVNMYSVVDVSDIYPNVVLVSASFAAVTGYKCGTYFIGDVDISYVEAWPHITPFPASKGLHVVRIPGTDKVLGVADDSDEDRIVASVGTIKGLEIEWGDFVTKDFASWAGGGLVWDEVAHSAVLSSREKSTGYTTYVVINVSRCLQMHDQ